MQTERLEAIRLGGRHFTSEDLELIKEIVGLYPGLSRMELSMTICENISWFAPNGKGRYKSCLGVIEKLEAQGYIKLPPLRTKYIRKRKEIAITYRSNPGESLFGRIDHYGGVKIRRAEKVDLGLWNEYVHRYHYLGYKTSFGLHQKYFIILDTQQIVGCLLYTVAAWALECRDKWIGWNAEERYRNLNKIVNNSRFLIFPWIKIKNLSSKALSLASKRIVSDWQDRFGYKPVLIESFVDSEKFKGSCYKAAGWNYLGKTKGIGNKDRLGKRRSTIKDVYISILDANFREELAQ